jgi:Ca-activated chloride channel homolog
MSRIIRMAALSVLSLSFATPPVAVPSVALAKPLDGEPTPAACRPLGFELQAEPDMEDVVVTASRVQGRTQMNAPPAPPS